MAGSSKSAEPAVLGDNALQSEQLESLTDAVNYRSWLVSLALPYVGDKLLEVGSGNGDYAAEFAARGIHIAAAEGGLSRLPKR